MEVVTYKNIYYTKLITFLEACLPESGRILDLSGRHKAYQNILEYFDMFWCMLDHEQIKMGLLL